MLLSRVGKKSKLTAHQTKTSKLTLSCSSVNIFVQEIKEKLTLESLNKRQTRRARPSSRRSTPLSLLLSSNERPISVTCQGSDCKFWTTFRSRAHGLLMKKVSFGRFQPLSFDFISRIMVPGPSSFFLTN